MKFYLETASGKFLRSVEGFKIELASYKYKPSPSAPEETQLAYTVEVDSLEELLSLVDKTGGAVVLEWQEKYPPATPRQHIPALRVVDDYL